MIDVGVSTCYESRSSQVSTSDWLDGTTQKASWDRSVDETKV